MRIAVKKDLLIHPGYRPGNFITYGSVLVTVWPGDKVDEKLSTRYDEKDLEKRYHAAVKAFD